jgi:hypothetical protein
LLLLLNVSLALIDRPVEVLDLPLVEVRGRLLLRKGTNRRGH